MKVQEDGSYDCRFFFDYGQLPSGVVAYYVPTCDAGFGKVDGTAEQRGWVVVQCLGTTA